MVMVCKILDDRTHRSNQFNDRLLSFCVTFVPNTFSIQYSFEDHEEVVQYILGNKILEEGESHTKVLLNIGPKLLARYYKILKKDKKWNQ